MRISVKMVLSGVCLLAGMVLFQGCQESNAPATGVKTEAKEAKPAVKAGEPRRQKLSRAKVEVAEAKTEVKAEVKEAKPEVKPAAPAVKAAEPNAVAENNGIAVTVNGKDITEADVDAKINAYMERMASQIPPGMAEQYKKQMRPQVVESMVMEQLLDEQIKKANINITDSDVNDKLNEIIASQPGMTMESFKEMIAAQGQSFER